MNHRWCIAVDTYHKVKSLSSRRQLASMNHNSIHDYARDINPNNNDNHLGLMGLPLTARFPVGKPVVPAALTWS